MPAAGAGIERRETPGVPRIQRQSAVLDQAMSALLADLQADGLLNQTLVVLGTEFGRTPRINDNDGQDHHEDVSAGRG